MALVIPVVKNEQLLSTPSPSTVKIYAVSKGKKGFDLKMKTSDGETVVLASTENKKEPKI